MPTNPSNLYDHQETGWWIPQVESEVQAQTVKRSVLEHTRANFGSQITDSCASSLYWMHDGRPYEAEVGKPIVFHGLKEEVWTILRDETRRLYLVITTNRGAIHDGPILVGYHDLGQRPSRPGR